MFKTYVASVVLLLALFNAVYGVDIAKDAKEMKECFVPNKTQPEPLDVQWFGSIKRIYYPYMSNHDLYIMALALLGGDYADFTHDDLTYDACVILTLNPAGEMVGYGFNGKSIKIYVAMTSRGMEEYYYAFDKGMDGTCWATLTDNKTFVVTLCCSNGDEMSWSVESPFPTLPKETLDQIHDHVASMGFSRDKFTQIHYDKCDWRYLGRKKEEL